MNNVENHGPGGQGQYGIPAEADPCFAKLVHNDHNINVSMNTVYYIFIYIYVLAICIWNE